MQAQHVHMTAPIMATHTENQKEMCTSYISGGEVPRGTSVPERVSNWTMEIGSASTGPCSLRLSGSVSSYRILLVSRLRSH